MGLTPEQIEFGVAANLVFCRLVPKRGAGRLWVEWVQLGRRRPIPVFSVDKRNAANGRAGGAARERGHRQAGGQRGGVKVAAIVRVTSRAPCAMRQIMPARVPIKSAPQAMACNAKPR